MRILLLAELADPAVGSWSRLTFQLAQDLQARGHECAVVGAVRTAEEARPGEVMGVPVHRIASDYPVRWRAWRSLHNPVVDAPFERILSELRPDIVHAHGLHTHLGYHALTQARRSLDNKAALAAFPEKDMVVYPATGTEQSRITVFTDTSCPYCRKLHREVPQLQQAGVTVRYIAFPRSGTRSEAAKTMRSVWCAKDRRKAMDAAKGIGTAEQGDAGCAEGKAVAAGYRLSRQAGRGHPARLHARGPPVGAPGAGGGRQPPQQHRQSMNINTRSGVFK